MVRASVLRMRGVPATTIHRILYTPVYDPQYERIAEWLTGNGTRPEVEGLAEGALDRAHLASGSHQATLAAPKKACPQRLKRLPCLTSMNNAVPSIIAIGRILARTCAS